MGQVGTSPARGTRVFESAGLDEEALASVAVRLGAILRPGEVVFLEGPLGAGKTTFVRSVARRLEVADVVRSPSFTVANIYRGAVRIHHLDLYRLEADADEDVLALEEYVAPDAITLVEWPEAGERRLGPPHWRVRLGHVSPTTRSLAVDADGPERVARWEAGG